MQLKHLPRTQNGNGETSQDSTPTCNTASSTFWEQYAADKTNGVAHDWVDWKRKQESTNTPKPMQTPYATTEDMLALKQTLDDFKQLQLQKEKEQLKTLQKQMEKGMISLVDTVKKQLKFATPEGHGDPDGSHDSSSSSNSSSTSSQPTKHDEEISDLYDEWDHSYPPEPLVPFKPPPKPQERFKGKKHGKLQNPISPKDPKFFVGCNDEVLDITTVGTEGTQDSKRRRHQKNVEDWMARMRKNTKSKLA